MALGGARVVLTGASGGLGGAIAHALDDKGARLVLSGRRRDRLEALAAELRDADVEPCDFADRQAVTTFAQSIEDADVLVANAALPGAGTLDDFTPAEIDRVLDVNLRAPILLSRHLAPLMTARRRGQLVFVSSMGAKLPVSRIAVYSATKSGLRGFAACLRQELTGTGVGVSVVFPGSVRDAGMFADSGATGGGRNRDIGRGRCGCRARDRTRQGRGRRRASSAARHGRFRQLGARRLSVAGPPRRRRQTNGRARRGAPRSPIAGMGEAREFRGRDVRGT
jgi:short-subunit dehydrogenase